MLQNKTIRRSLVIGLGGWVLATIAALAFGSDALPLVAVILVITAGVQAWALLYRPKGPLYEAQQLFMAGQYEDAAQRLETLLSDSLQGLDAVMAQTLLGNTYRQMGQLEKSEVALRQAVDAAPTGHFPLYGLGRTLLVQGEYAAAAQYIEQALMHGGRKAIRADLALAHYLNDDDEAAAKAAAKAARILRMEAHRMMIANYILHRVKDDPQAPDMMARAADGLAFWQADAGRFAETVYGKRLKEEISAIERIVASSL